MNGVPGAEDGREFVRRFDEAVAAIADDGHATALLVSHGAAIRVWVANCVYGAGTHPMAAQGFTNTACIEIEGTPEVGWRIRSWTADPIGGVFLEDEGAPDPTGQ